MQRGGKRKSPFIGKTEPLRGDGGPILYSRFMDLSEIPLVKPVVGKQPVDSSPSAAVESSSPSVPAAANGHALPVDTDLASGKQLKKQKVKQHPTEAQQPTVARLAEPSSAEQAQQSQASPASSPQQVAAIVSAAAAAEKAAFAAKKLAKRQKLNKSAAQPQPLEQPATQQLVRTEDRPGTAQVVQGPQPDVTSTGPSAHAEAAAGADGAPVHAAKADMAQQQKRAKRAKQESPSPIQQPPPAALSSAAAKVTEDTPAASVEQPGQQAPSQYAPQHALTREEEEIAERKRIKRAKRAARRQNRPAATPSDNAEQPDAAPAGGIEVVGGDAAAAVPAAVSGSQLPEPKKKKKADKKAAAAKVVSGPANAEEAKTIRQALGIDPANPASTKVPHNFSFGFSLPDPAPADLSGPAAEDDGGDPASDEPESDEAAQDARQDDESAQLAEAAPAKPQVAAPAGESDDRAAVNGAMPNMDSADAATRARLERIMGNTSSSGLERRVFVGGMPFSYEEEDIREYWSYCGAIEDLDMMRFPDSHRFKGIVFITFATEEGYKAALECDGEELDGQRLKVEKCISAGRKESRAARKQAEKARPLHTAPAPKTPGYHVAYVGNVAFEASAKELEAVFEGCQVTLVRLHTDKDTGKSKGYAHVHFADEESLDRAMEFTGADLMGRAIKVGYAQPKKN